MSPILTSTSTADPTNYSLERGWRTLAIAGGVVGLLGLLAIAAPFVTGVSVTLLLGAVLVAGGIVHGAHAVTARGWRGQLWQATLGVVSIVAGLILLANPVLGLASLTVLAIAYLLVDGVAELWLGVRSGMADQPGRRAIAASGALSVVLAVLLWAAFPADAAWAVGTLVGVALFVTGISMAAVAVAGRDAAAKTPSATEPRRA
ncbi:HdeD family acid-resistance protein [Halobiforma nitratireducens]|uniref:HdeD family acid-resistance protein n=1 Tax=Halobiforma nitratireducens JCM 10879 TaxID=1227454 RepID=M0LBZ9_9EURY|nr:DUF308 domain-containing protein [Halobiforma nitratireducens]EMA31101.1 hypothetical protein C446_16215 [Halobiforma nitratireducens JCM 10879]